MSQVSIRNSMSLAGTTAQDNKTLEVDNIISATEDIVAGDSGTAGESGVMTLSSGHGITDANTVAVIWALGYRYGCTVDSYGDTSVTLSGGAGDTLPTSGAVVVSVQSEIDLAFAGAQLQALSMGGDIALIIALEDVGGVELVKAIDANAAYQWNSENGETNPVDADNIIKATAYAQSTTAGTATVLAAYNND
jgi:hypothetical protein